MLNDAGGVLAPDGCIYGVPCNATNVLKITPGPSPKVETFGDLPEMRQKWYGGLLASDGCIYCIPNNADKVLKIIPGELVSTGLDSFSSRLRAAASWQLLEPATGLRPTNSALLEG